MKSSPQSIPLERITPIMVISNVPIVIHITMPHKIAPMTIPGHHAFDGSKMAEPRKIPHQTSQKRRGTRASRGLIGSSGSPTTSPRRIGDIRSIHSRSPAPYCSALKLGVKFSSIILLDMRSVITPSKPRPTSIRISRSVGATRIRSPLSRPFWPIHHERARVIPTSSIVLPWRLLIIAIPI